MKKIKLLSILVLASVVLFAGCKKDDSVSKTYTLNVTATNGTVVKNPDMATYNSGAKVQLTATPNSDYKFSSWSGDTTSSSNPLTVIMTANKDIIANFTVIVVNVKSTGATGNGSTDDTAAIQTAIDQIAGTGGTVLVPAGSYMINALKSLNLKSKMTLRMESGAVLKAITNNAQGYNIIAIANVSNVTVIGGTIQGERATHTGTEGQWGMGIGFNNAQNVLIDGVTAKDCWGDGFYIGGASTNITLDNVVADNNRRQGLSIVSGDSVIVRNSIFKNTGGHPPMAGIDVEPNEGQTVSNVQIINNEVMGNQLDGIAAYSQFSNSHITNLIISENNVHNNGTQGQGTYAIELITVSGANISGNNVHNNIRGGILIYEFSMGNTITNNIVTDNGNPTDDYDYGIALSSGSTGNTVTGNTVTGHLPKDIIDVVGGNTINGNKTSN